MYIYTIAVGEGDLQTPCYQHAAHPYGDGQFQAP